MKNYYFGHHNVPQMGGVTIPIVGEVEPKSFLMGCAFAFFGLLLTGQVKLPKGTK